MLLARELVLCLGNSKETEMMYGKEYSKAEMRKMEEDTRRGGENEVRGSLDAQKALGRTLKPSMPQRMGNRKMKR